MIKDFTIARLTVNSRQAPEGSPEDTPHGTTFTVRLPAAVGVE